MTSVEVKYFPHTRNNTYSPSKYVSSQKNTYKIAERQTCPILQIYMVKKMNNGLLEKGHVKEVLSRKAEEDIRLIR